MGKRIIQQRRGRGSPTYRVKSSIAKEKVGYPKELRGKYEVVNLISSPLYTAPLAKLKNNEKVFCIPAANLTYIGQKISFGGNNNSDISRIGDLKNGTEIFNIENRPFDGGKLVRSAGSFAIIISKTKNKVNVMMPSKKVRQFLSSCRATVGRAAGDGRIEKPILKAGKKYHIMKSKSKPYPRTSAVAMNAIDHPFGSGRGKRIKSKIPKRHAPPGKKVGLLRPRRAGRKKR